MTAIAASSPSPRISGVRVGVRGALHALRLAETPPHPESARKRADS
ncbi:MAG: hypothetical protein QOK01_3000, partial [Alphaproteobacteria bacterium]|nr:hypothetical protein [Alphaproteobacteria bacterium]